MSKPSYDKLVQVARQFGVSKAVDIAAALDESAQTLNNWRRRGVSAHALPKIVRVFSVDLDDFLSGTELDASAQEFVPLAPMGAGADSSALHPDVDPTPIGMTTRRVPVVGTAQAGDDGYWHEMEYPPGHGDGFVFYPTKDPNSYAVRIKGDSMRPRYRPGEFVVIEPNEPVHPGDEVLVVTVDGRSMLKVLASRRDGMVELISVNRDHQPISLEFEEIAKMHFVSGGVSARAYYRGL